MSAHCHDRGGRFREDWLFYSTVYTVEWLSSCQRHLRGSIQGGALSLHSFVSLILTFLLHLFSTAKVFTVLIDCSELLKNNQTSTKMLSFKNLQPCLTFDIHINLSICLHCITRSFFGDDANGRDGALLAAVPHHGATAGRHLSLQWSCIVTLLRESCQKMAGTSNLEPLDLRHEAGVLFFEGAALALEESELTVKVVHLALEAVHVFLLLAPTLLRGNLEWREILS